MAVSTSGSPDRPGSPPGLDYTTFGTQLCSKRRPLQPLLCSSEASGDRGDYLRFLSVLRATSTPNAMTNFVDLRTDPEPYASTGPNRITPN